MAADEDHLTSIPRSPTDHEQEISAAASDNVNISREYPYNANLGDSISSISSSGGNNSNRSRVGSGHERVFVQPASYLRRRGLSHPMAPSQPERAIDVEEQKGLVSNSCYLQCW